MDCEAHHQEETNDRRPSLFWRFYYGRNALEMCVLATVSHPRGIALGV